MALPKITSDKIKQALLDVGHIMAMATDDWRRGGTGRFRSQAFCRCDTRPVQIDFLAGFEVNGPDSWAAVPPNAQVQIMIEDTELFVPGIQALIDMHILIARPKDIERVALLRGLLAEQ